MSKADPRKITDVAIDCAIHALPEPRNGWRDHLPPEDLGAMVSAGSGQITLQALIAALHYDRNKSYALRALNRYADICPARFGLSEPWSWIYFKAIVCCWAAVVVIAERINERALAARFRALISTWAGTCALMEVDGVIMAAGCRCWGHETHGGGWDDLWAFAKGRREPPMPGSRSYGLAGASDDWGWLNRCARVALSVFRSEASPYLGRTWESLLPSIPRWAARTEMQLIGYEDGSRLWIMGDDEPEFDDEDANSNTPGWLLAGKLGGKIVTLPIWPNPFDGTKRVRQESNKADIDGSPLTGWTLLHTRLGQVKSGDKYLSRVEPYPSRVVFHVLIYAGDKVWRQPTSPLQSIQPQPSEPSQPSVTVTVRQPRKWWQLWKWFKGGQ